MFGRRDSGAGRGPKARAPQPTPLSRMASRSSAFADDDDEDFPDDDPVFGTSASAALPAPSPRTAEHRAHSVGHHGSAAATATDDDYDEDSDVVRKHSDARAPFHRHRDEVTPEHIEEDSDALEGLGPGDSDENAVSEVSAYDDTGLAEHHSPQPAHRYPPATSVTAVPVPKSTAPPPSARPTAGSTAHRRSATGDRQSTVVSRPCRPRLSATDVAAAAGSASPTNTGSPGSRNSVLASPPRSSAAASPGSCSISGLSPPKVVSYRPSKAASAASPVDAPAALAGTWGTPDATPPSVPPSATALRGGTTPPSSSARTDRTDADGGGRALSYRGADDSVPVHAGGGRAAPARSVHTPQHATSPDATAAAPTQTGRSPSLPTKTEQGVGASASSTAGGVDYGSLSKSELADLYLELFERRNRINAALVRIQSACRERADSCDEHVVIADGVVAFEPRRDSHDESSGYLRHQRHSPVVARNASSHHAHRSASVSSVASSGPAAPADGDDGHNSTTTSLRAPRRAPQSADRPSARQHPDAVRADEDDETDSADDGEFHTAPPQYRRLRPRSPSATPRGSQDLTPPRHHADPQPAAAAAPGGRGGGTQGRWARSESVGESPLTGFAPVPYSSGPVARRVDAKPQTTPAMTLQPPRAQQPLQQQHQQQHHQRQVSYATVDDDDDCGEPSLSVDGSFDAASAAGTMPPATSPEPVPPPGHLSIHRSSVAGAVPGGKPAAKAGGEALILGPAKIVAAANRPASAVADTFTFTAIKPRGPVTTIKTDAPGSRRAPREVTPPAPVVLRNVRVSESPMRRDDSLPEVDDQIASRRPVVGYVPPGGGRREAVGTRAAAAAPSTAAVAFTFAPINAGLPPRRQQ